jgi:hypothetical protein
MFMGPVGGSPCGVNEGDGVRACQAGSGLSTRRGRWFAIGLLWAGSVLFTVLPGPAFGQFNGSYAIERFELDDENFLDWKAYQLPQRWRYASYAAPNLFQGSVGSISLDRFYLSHQIRLEADLGEYASFLYNQEEEAFYRSEPIYQEIELRAGSQVYGSLLGWVEGDKRYDNIGFAVAYGKRTDWNYVRLSRVNQYPLFNEKNSQGNHDPLHYDETPVLLRLEARQFWNDRLFVQVDLKREEPAKFEDRGNGVDSGYEGREGDLTVDWWGPDRSWLAGITGSLDEEKRGQSPAAGNAAVVGMSQTLLLRWWDLYYGLHVGDGDFLTLGYLDAVFSNRIRSADGDSRFRTQLTTQSLYATWETSPGSFVHWLFGLYAGNADSETRKGIAAPRPGNEDHTQLKGSAGLVLEDAAKYRFLFNSTWDLDIIEQRAWDGGNVQVQLFF